MASELGWSLGDLQHAREVLIDQLRDLLPPEILDPPLQDGRGFGALDPALLRRSGAT
jgi:hypothetical protein